MKSARNSFARGVAAYRKGAWKAAAEAFRRTLAERPDHPRALENLALSLMKAGDPEAAVQAARRAEELSPGAREAHHLGQVEMAADHFEEARAAFQRAGARGLDPIAAATGEAACLALQGRGGEARARLDRILAERRDDPEALYWRALAAAQDRDEAGLWDMAVSDLRRILDTGKCQDAWLLGRTHLLLASVLDDRPELFEEAARHYRQGLKYDPTSALGHNNLGAVLRELGRHEEARSHLVEALVLSPAYRRAQLNLARLYHEVLDETALAEDFRELAARLGPEALALSVAGLSLELMDVARKKVVEDHYQQNHRLKNLLAVQGGRLRRLARAAGETPGAEPVAKGLEAILSHHDSLYQSLAEALAVRGTGRGETRRFDPLAIARGVARSLAGEHDEVTIEAVPTGPRPRLRGDAEALREVLVDLVRNALEALRGPGTVRILVGPDEALPGTLVLEVQDDGPGIAPEHLGEIFRMGFTTKPQGSGVGLASVRRTVAREFRGTVAAANRPEGGARFVIRLPVSDSEPQSRGLGLAARHVDLEEPATLQVDELT